MGSDSYRAELARLQKDLASIQKDLSAQISNSSKARSEAAKKRHSAATSSGSTRASYIRAAESEDKKLVAAEKKIAELQTKIAGINTKQHRAEGHLASALKSERADADRKEEQRKRKEKSERDARDRDDARRRQTEKSHAREVARLSTATVRHIIERAPEPEVVRVLYLTSSPNLSEPVRVDAEVNLVLKQLRSVKHRDLIELHHRPAATPEDLLDGINDLRPHVIHFSGHGNGSGVLFDDGDFDAPVGEMMDFDTLGRILKATNSGPTLLVLNACKSVTGAEVLLESVPVIVAMSDSVADMSAGLFATHFYAGIGGAQSIGHAAQQAREMIALALPGEPDLIEIRAAEGVDVDNIVLVKPSTS